MPSTRVLIKPFDNDGNYVSDWIDVTKYVTKIGNIEVDADSLDYQLGVFRNSNVDITFSNRAGRFSDVDIFESLFRYKRNDTQIQVRWAEWDHEPVAGFVQAPFYFGSELTIFDGILSDDATRENAKTEEIPFKALGLEALFARVEVPTTIAIGDSVSEIIYATLNQSPITDLLTVSLSNITPDLDLELDAVAFLENKTGKDLLDQILKPANSICYIKERVVYVKPRDATASLIKTFYGPASTNGLEDLIDAKNISSGLNRVFNLFFWRENLSAKEKDNASIARNGVRKKELTFDGYTDGTKQSSIAAALLAEFKDPKKELEIVVPATAENVTLNLMDKVNIDYPTVFVAEPGEELPICGVAVLGEAVLPRGLWALTLSTIEFFKVINKKIDVNKQEVTLKLRGV